MTSPSGKRCGFAAGGLTRLMQIEQYRSRVEAMLRDALSARRSVEVIFSERRGVEAAYMLAISELATTGAHLEQLLRR